MWRLRNEHVLAPTPKLQPLERQLPHSHTKTCYCKDSGQTQCYFGTKSCRHHVQSRSLESILDVNS